MAAATPCWPAPVSATTPRLAHALGQQRLAQHVVDLVRSGVVEVLPLQQERAAELGGEPLGLVEERRAAGVVAEQAVELRRGRPGRPTPPGTPGRARRRPSRASRGCSARRSRRSARTARGHPSPARRTSVEREPRTSASASPFELGGAVVARSGRRWNRTGRGGGLRVGTGRRPGAPDRRAPQLRLVDHLPRARADDGLRGRRADQRGRLRPRRGGVHRPPTGAAPSASGSWPAPWSSTWVTRPSIGWAATQPQALERRSGRGLAVRHRARRRARRHPRVDRPRRHAPDRRGRQHRRSSRRCSSPTSRRGWPAAPGSPGRAGRAGTSSSCGRSSPSCRRPPRRSATCPWTAPPRRSPRSPSPSPAARCSRCWPTR